MNAVFIRPAPSFASVAFNCFVLYYRELFCLYCSERLHVSHSECMPHVFPNTVYLVIEFPLYVKHLNCHNLFLQNLKQHILLGMLLFLQIRIYSLNDMINLVLLWFISLTFPILNKPVISASLNGIT